MARGFRGVGQLIGLAGALLLGVAGLAPAPASAAGVVTQVINCGGGGNSLAASVADLTLNAATFSTVAQDSQGNLTLSAAEQGCAAQGWKVTIQVGSSRVDLQACKLEYSIVSPK